MQLDAIYIERSVCITYLCGFNCIFHLKYSTLRREGTDPSAVSGITWSECSITWSHLSYSERVRNMVISLAEWEGRPSSSTTAAGWVATSWPAVLTSYKHSTWPQLVGTMIVTMASVRSFSLRKCWVPDSTKQMCGCGYHFMYYHCSTGQLSEWDTYCELSCCQTASCSTWLVWWWTICSTVLTLSLNYESLLRQLVTWRQ